MEVCHFHNHLPEIMIVRISSSFLQRHPCTVAAEAISITVTAATAMIPKLLEFFISMKTSLFNIFELRMFELPLKSNKSYLV